MMRTVQFAMRDAEYAASLQDALSRSGPWHVESVDSPDPALPFVLVLDDAAFERLPRPLAHPERIVLISRQDPQLLAQAWDAGIVSVAKVEDPLPTVLLAIMAAALRAAKAGETAVTSEISPSPPVVSARKSPQDQTSQPRRCRPP